MMYNQSEFLIETSVPEGEEIVSRTNLEGIITYANDAFCKISGYEKEELLGRSHNIVRHPDMPTSVYKELWHALQTNKRWEGIVKNLRKDGGFYWVHAMISGIYKDGVLVGYKSLRTPINYDEKLRSQKLYDVLRAKNGEKIRKIIYE